MSIYQFNLKGIGNDVQIGKGNARIRSSGDSIKFVKAAHDGTVTFNSIAASDLLDIQTNQISLGSNTLTLNDTGGTSNGGQIAFTRNNANSGAAETLTFSGLNSGSGTTILNVDFDGDITLDSGTKIDIKTTAANGDITILPNGTGDLVTKFGGDTADSKFIIKNNSNTERFVVDALGKITLTQDASASGNAFTLTSADVDSVALDIDASQTTGDVVDITANSLTTGSGLKISSSSANTSSRNILDIVQTGTGGDDSNALIGLNIDFDVTSGTAARALKIDSEQTTGIVAEIDATQVTTGSGMLLSANALTSGNAFKIESSSNSALTSGNLLYISHTGNANTVVGPISEIVTTTTSTSNSFVLSKFTADSITQGKVINVSGNSLTTGVAINLNVNALTSGQGINVASTSTSLTGDLIKFNNSGNDTGVTGDLMDISLTGAANVGKVLNITQSSTSGAASRAVNITSSQTDAIVMQMTTDSVSTGKVIDITADGLTSGVGFNFESTATGLTGDVIKILNSGNNSGVTGDLMDISLTGAANLGKVLNITQSSTSGASSRSVNITSSQTDATVMQITADSISTGKVIDITADGLTTGSVLNIEVAGSTLTSGNAINVNLAPTSNAANITDYLAKFTTTASTNSGAGIASFVGNSLTTGDAVFINANSNSSGNILHIKGTGIQQKWSYDSDSFATITVADNSDTTFATGESGNLTLDVAQNFTLDADSSGDGSIDIDAGTGGITIDSTSTSAGIKIGTVTSGVPISIGHTTSEVTINDNLTVTGNFTVNGDSITKNVTTLNVEDPLIKLNNYSNSLYDDENDIGFFGQYGNSSGTQYYTGLARARGSKMFYLFSELTPDPEATVSAPGFGSSLDIASNSLSDIKFNASGTASNLAIGQVFRVAQYKRSGWQVNNSSGYSIGETGNISIEQHSSHSSSVVAGDRIYIISSNAMVEVGTVKSVTTDGGSEVISFDGTGTLVALVDNQPLYVLQSDNGTVRVTNATASSYACSIVSAGSGYTDITNASAGTDDTAVGNGTFLEYIYVQNEVVKNITDKASSESSYKASVWADIQGNFINTNSITLSTSDNINLIGKIGLNNILLKRITIKVTTAITGGTALAGIAVFKSSTDGTDKTVANDRGTVIATNDFIGNIVGTYVIDFDPYVSNNVITSGNYLKLSAVDSSDSINETNVSISAGVVKVFVDYVTYDGTIYE